jgi:hypothetical protein
MYKNLRYLLRPKKLWSRADIFEKPCPVPRASGLYAWYFKDIPPQVPTTGCITKNGLTLLYIGISPSTQPSKRNLYSRIRYHMRGNASGSTLRFTLGCLLNITIGIRLQPTGRTKRLTFGEGELTLSDWLEQNAYVAWVVREEPWLLENDLISKARPPLNLRGNEQHPFYPILKKIRREARETAVIT